MKNLRNTLAVIAVMLFAYPMDAQSDRTFTVNGVSFEMVYVRGGAFTMGATSEQGSEADNEEKPTHRVTLSDYYIGKYEVTQGQWKAVTGNNPSHFKRGDSYPVEWASWNDIQQFIQKLNEQTGRRYALPTEAQWEYAARGGHKGRGYKYSGRNSIGSVAWYEDNSGSATHPVGTKSPNELGLYDMSGNVGEWCADRYGDYSADSQTNPRGPLSGSCRVLRGGSWFDDARCCRVSSRDINHPDDRDHGLGFRLTLCSLPPSDSSPANYYFDSSESVIEGTIGTETFYDANDQEEACVVLYLDKPVNVLAGQDVYSENVYGISKMQLVYTGDSPVNFDSCQGRRVRLTGTFMYWHTAHHHTPALMLVKKWRMKD